MGSVESYMPTAGGDTRTAVHEAHDEEDHRRLMGVDGDW